MSHRILGTLRLLKNTGSNRNKVSRDYWYCEQMPPGRGLYRENPGPNVYEHPAEGWYLIRLAERSNDLTIMEDILIYLPPDVAEFIPL